jgi:DNA-binding MarR family transcriptional regulator
VTETTDPATGSGTRWLTDEETDAWRAVAGLMFQLPGALESQLQRDSGLSLFEYLVLSSLSMEPDRTARMSELAKLSNGSLSRLSNVVKRLEGKGWVRRRLDSCDGRYTVAVLTDAGWDVVVAAAPGHVDAVRRLVIDPLTRAQQRAVAAAGRRIQDRIDATPRDEAPRTDPCAPC